MIVEQIWTANPGRNCDYLIACGETGELLAVDPRHRYHVPPGQPPSIRLS